MASKFIWQNMRRHYIREHLQVMGKSQEWLAGCMNNTKPGTLSRWINDPGRVNMHILSAVADCLELDSVAELLEPPQPKTARAILQQALDALPADPAEE